MERDSKLFVEGHRVLEMVAKAVVGKEGEILRVFLAILAGGHILLEDMPGVGKTTLALAFTKALGLDYNRMQFSPDVLPSDVTGFSVFNKDAGRMDYMPGAILCNLFLADELNRATSRTQSALLEAMEEGQVTVDGVSHLIPQPFVVIATQNPAGASGTQLLPDSQLDRFMVRLSLGYPSREDEALMLQRKQEGGLLDEVSPVVSREVIMRMREEAGRTHVHPDILAYIVALVSATRSHPGILAGASPRASIALTGIAKALAYLQGRDYVIPKDIAPLFSCTIAHRLTLRPGAENEWRSAEYILDGILKTVSAPQMR